jgi:hypothetical protein
MNDIVANTLLSTYDRYILNRILPAFSAEKNFNIYDLVEESVSHKCILPSQNSIIMDTFYCIKEYLVAQGFVLEKREMISYVLTGKGIQLKLSGSIEKYEANASRKNKPSIIDLIFKTKRVQGNATL